jgi:hypothetical protein
VTGGDTELVGKELSKAIVTTTFLPVSGSQDRSTSGDLDGGWGKRACRPSDTRKLHAEGGSDFLADPVEVKGRSSASSLVPPPTSLRARGR